MPVLLAPCSFWQSVRDGGGCVNRAFSAHKVRPHKGKRCGCVTERFEPEASKHMVEADVRTTTSLERHGRRAAAFFMPFLQGEGHYYHATDDEQSLLSLMLVLSCMLFSMHAEITA